MGPDVEKYGEQEERTAVAAPVDLLVMRNTDIAKRVLIDRVSMKYMADKYGITQPRVRQIIHSFCRRTNRDLYENLKRSNTYEGGWTNDHCLPYLSVLRDNAQTFFGA